MNTFLKITLTLTTACLLFSLFLAFKDITAECLKYDEIEFIGGCDRFGECSYMTKSKFKGINQHPVIGERVCIKKDL